MSTLYQLTRDPAMVRIGNDLVPANDPGNSDSARYLEWLAAGNVPDPLPPPSPEELDALARAEAAPFIERGIAALNGLGLDVLLTELPAPAPAPAKPPGVLIAEAREDVIAMKTLDLTGCADYAQRKQRYKLAWASIAITFAPYPDLKLKFEREIK